MRRVYTLFCCMFVSVTNAATFSAVKVPMCGYGMYRYKGSCVSLADQAESCSALNGVSTYRVALDSNTFMYQGRAEIICLGTHVLYEYNDALLTTMPSGGTLRSFGPPMCGYNQYRLNNKCYQKTDATAVGMCPENFHKTGNNSASFMSLFVQENVCLGTYSEYEYSERLYPIYNGFLMSVGAPLQTAADMRATKCSVNPDSYYMIAVATEDGFMHPELGTCPTTSSKFVAGNDCKDINTSDESELSKNPICGVLCNSGVYTNSGICADGYCEYANDRKRIFYSKDNTTHSVPLYSSPTTTPALNILFTSDNGTNQTCYMNLVPGAAQDAVHIQYNNTTYYGID